MKSPPVAGADVDEELDVGVGQFDFEELAGWVLGWLGTFGLEDGVSGCGNAASNFLIFGTILRKLCFSGGIPALL